MVGGRSSGVGCCVMVVRRKRCWWWAEAHPTWGAASGRWCGGSGVDGGRKVVRRVIAVM